MERTDESERGGGGVGVGGLTAYSNTVVKRGTSERRATLISAAGCVTRGRRSPRTCEEEPPAPGSARRRRRREGRPKIDPFEAEPRAQGRKSYFDFMT